MQGLFSVSDVAALLKLKAEPVNGKTEWHGANPSGAGAMRDGFILYEEGNAWDRSIDARYKSFEVARMAGIEPGQYEPCIEYSNAHPNGFSPNGFPPNGHTANGHSSTNGAVSVSKIKLPEKPAPTATEPKTYDTRTLEERGVSRATLGLFHVAFCTRGNRKYKEFRCWEYPAYFVDGRQGRCRQKVCDPNQTKGDKYFWAGGDKDSMPCAYNLHHVRQHVEAGQTEMWIVESEVSTWLMHQSGLPCVNPFGSLRHIDRLIRQLKEEGIQSVQIAFDCDKAGRAGALKTLEAAREVGLTATVRKMLAPPESGYDVDDLFNDCGQKAPKFVAALKSLPVVGARELECWKEGRTQEQQTEREEEKADPKAAKAERLLAMLDGTAGVELFHTSDDECYIVLPQQFASGERIVTFPLSDAKFHRHLVHRYQRETKRVLESAVVENVVRVLEGRAFEEGHKQTVAVRVGEHNGRIYIDLCNDEWQAVEIGSDVPGGWQIITNPPVHFRRAKGMEALPIPVRGGSWDELRPLMNAEDDSNWMMIVAWLVTALRPPKYPYPILAVHGEQDSGKSSLSRMVRKIIDPNYTSLVGTSTRDERDLAIIAKNSFVIGFDNLSRVPQWFNDVLCSLVTEGSFRTRKMRADDEEMLFKAIRPIILNGINENLGQNDLRRRMFKLWLPPIPEPKKRDEMEVWDDFYKVWPRILGCLCDALCVANANVASVVLPRRVGLIDAAKWVIAAEPVLPWETGEFARVYLDNQQQAIDAANEANPVTMTILTLMERYGGFKGTADELLHQLNGLANEDTRRSPGWPSGAIQIGLALSRIAPNLRAVGIDFQRAAGHAKGRKMVLRHMTPDEMNALNPPTESEAEAETDGESNTESVWDAPDIFDEPQ